MKPFKILVVSSFEYVAFYLCRFNLAPILPILMAHLGITHGEAGALASAIFVSYAIALLPAGILGDYFGPKRVIALGAVISALSNISFPYALSFPHMLLVQLCNGFGQGMAWGPLTRLMSNWYPKERMGFVMSVLSVPPAVGPVLAYVLAGYFATAYNWRMVFIYPSLILLILTCAFWVWVRDRPSGASKGREGLLTKGRIRRVFHNKSIWFVALAYLCLSACGRGLLTWLPTYLSERAGLSLFWASVLGGVVSLSGVGTMFIGTWLADVRLRGNKKAVIMFSFVSSALVIAALPQVADPILVLMAFSLTFALLYFGGGLYFAYPSIFLPTEVVGTAAGLIDTLGYVGNFLGTLLIGLLFDLYRSYDPAFTALALIAMTGTLIAFKIQK